MAAMWISSVLSSAALAATTADRIVLPSGVTPSSYELRITPELRRMSFNGTVKITIMVDEPTRQIVLNAAELKFEKVALSGSATAPEISFDSDKQTATLQFAAPVPAGAHLLTIEYQGKINRNAAGLFALEYSTSAGKKQAIFTQFENSDARRFLPCWDEPAQKATFTLIATVPEADLAVSNMPVASTVKLHDGLKRVRFARTPKMSPYLLFFGAGDLERIARKVHDTEVGVVVTRGSAAEAQFALDAASQLLPYYEQYFGVKFPLPKLDLIAGPGQSQFFGAMENWGAMFFFEREMLIEQRISTEYDRRMVYVIVAHEMAHQWFGDLVTMQWWDDLWLNEGFASWMENKASDHFHPEWKLGLDAQYEKEEAMRIDALQGTHPIVQPVADVLQANQAFDAITYLKGESVIRMLEAYLGEDAFRAGVRRYIKAHAYGNTVTDDLWRELDASSSTNVLQIAHDFTLQAGVPLIEVKPQTRGIGLSQDRFAAETSARTPTRWHVPVIERGLDARTNWRGTVARGQPVVIAGEPSEGMLVNAGQAGYFRTLYAAPMLRPLIAHFQELPAPDELGLLDDSRALGYSGYEALSDFLDIANAASPDTDPAVLKSLARQLAKIDSLYDGLPGQSRFRVFCRHVLSPAFAKVGWTAQTGESQNVALLRAALLSALSRCDDEGVISAARARFAEYLKDPQTLSGDLRRSVLAIVAAHADAAAWEQLHKMATDAGNNLEKAELYDLLGRAQDRELANRALQLCLLDEIPLTLRLTIIRQVAASYHPEMAFDFSVANLDRVNAMLEPDSRDQFVPQLASNSKNPEMIPKLRAFAEAHIPPNARKEAVMAEGAIAYFASVRANRLGDIDRWLMDFSARN
jgi:aminopeptidase N